MTNPTQQPSPAAPTPSEGVSGGGLIKSYDERAAEAFGELTNETQEPVGQSGTPPAPDEAAAQRAARRKELDAVLAEEAARVDAHARRKQGDEAVRRAQALERENQDLKQQMAARVDPSSLDEKGFFDLAEKLHDKGVTPKKLGEWLQQRATHPEVIAAQYAKQAVDPMVQELRNQLAEQGQQLTALQQQKAAEQAMQQAYARGESMLGFAQQNTTQAPYAAAFLREHGEQEFLELANGLYAGVPKGPGWEQHVLDAIEDRFAALAKMFQPQSGTNQQRQAPPPPNPGAAKPMTTVSNTLAQTRASVVDEETDWAALPYEERAARLFR